MTGGKSSQSSEYSCLQSSVVGILYDKKWKTISLLFKCREMDF